MEENGSFWRRENETAQNTAAGRGKREETTTALLDLSRGHGGGVGEHATPISERGIVVPATHSLHVVSVFSACPFFFFSLMHCTRVNGAASSVIVLDGIFL